MDMDKFVKDVAALLPGVNVSIGSSEAGIEVTSNEPISVEKRAAIEALGPKVKVFAAEDQASIRAAVEAAASAAEADEMRKRDAILNELMIRVKNLEAVVMSLQAAVVKLGASGAAQDVLLLPPEPNKTDEELR